MIVFIIELIFSLLGIVGIFLNNTVLIVTGLVIIVIGDLIDIFINKTNPTTVILAILLASGASIANHNPLVSFTFSLCAESLIMSFIGIIATLPNIAKKNKKIYSNAWEERMDTLYSNNKKGTFLRDVKLKK